VKCQYADLLHIVKLEKHWACFSWLEVLASRLPDLWAVNMM